MEYVYGERPGRQEQPPGGAWISVDMKKPQAYERSNDRRQVEPPGRSDGVVQAVRQAIVELTIGREEVPPQRILRIPGLNLKIPHETDFVLLT